MLIYPRPHDPWKGQGTETEVSLVVAYGQDSFKPSVHPAGIATTSLHRYTFFYVASGVWVAFFWVQINVDGQIVLLKAMPQGQKAHPMELEPSRRLYPPLPQHSTNTRKGLDWIDQLSPQGQQAHQKGKQANIEAHEADTIHVTWQQFSSQLLSINSSS